MTNKFIFLFFLTLPPACSAFSDIQQVTPEIQLVGQLNDQTPFQCSTSQWYSQLVFLSYNQDANFSLINLADTLKYGFGIRTPENETNLITLFYQAQDGTSHGQLIPQCQLIVTTNNSGKATLIAKTLNDAFIQCRFTGSLSQHNESLNLSWNKSKFENTFKNR